MLVLTFNVDGRIFIGPDIVVTLCDVSKSGRQARVAIQAPDSVEIMREEKLTAKDKRRQIPRPKPEDLKRAKAHR